MRTSALVLVALLLAGCDTTVDPAGLAAGVASYADATPGNLPSATGHAEIGVDLAGQTLLQRYAFTAQRVGKEQIIQGRWELNQEYPGQNAALSGQVTCFDAVGNVARIAGVIERSDNPQFAPGQHVVWKVVDSGEGTNDPRDLASPMSLSAFPNNFCGGGSPAMSPIVSGNIQVRGGVGQN